MTQIYKNVGNQEIDITFDASVESASEITVNVLFPDRTTTLTWLLSDVNNSLINNIIFRHTTENNELTQDGVYILTTQLTLAGVEVPSKVITITVFDQEDIVIIHDTDLLVIKSQLGYPLEDNIVLDDDQIKTICIRRALEDYFKKFPKVVDVEQVTGFETETTFDFPTDLTFGVKDVRVVNKGSVTSKTDSFWTLIKYNNLYGDVKGLGTRGKYGTGYSFDSYGLSNSFLQRDVVQSVINETTIKYRVNPSARQLFVYSELEGIINITWASYSYNFNEIKFEQKKDVIDLSGAYLKLHLADTSGITSDATQDVTINSDELRTQATETMTEIYEKWATYPDIIVVRDSR